MDANFLKFGLRWSISLLISKPMWSTTDMPGSHCIVCGSRIVQRVKCSLCSKYRWCWGISTTIYSPLLCTEVGNGVEEATNGEQTWSILLGLSCTASRDDFLGDLSRELRVLPASGMGLLLYNFWLPANGCRKYSPGKDAGWQHIFLGSSWEPKLTRKHQYPNGHNSVDLNINLLKPRAEENIELVLSPHHAQASPCEPFQWIWVIIT